MDYDQDYSKLTATDGKWYEDIANEKSSLTRDRSSDSVTGKDGNSPGKICVYLDDEDFN